jgi:hypothetical protein
MTVNTNMVEEFSFSNEENIATACSSALRKVRTLADSAPIGRLFASITTLSEASSQISQQMKAYAKPTAITEVAAPLPMHFKRRG